MLFLDKKQVFEIYLAAPSMRAAAKQLGISVDKLRKIRTDNMWPIKIGHNGEKIMQVRSSKKYSIYDAIDTVGGLSESDLKRALEL
jgi:hypothetical protein